MCAAQLVLRHAPSTRLALGRAGFAPFPRGSHASVAFYSSSAAAPPGDNGLSWRAAKAVVNLKKIKSSNPFFFLHYFSFTLLKQQTMAKTTRQQHSQKS